MTPSEIVRVLGIDPSEDDSKVLEALSTLSLHLERRQFKEMYNPEVGMLVRVKCVSKANAFYHGREAIITHVIPDKVYAFFTDTKKVADGSKMDNNVLQFIGKASKAIWEVKYPELKDLWDKVT